MKKAVQSSGPSRKTRAALTPEARENQLIARAIDLAEKTADGRHRLLPGHHSFSEVGVHQSPNRETVVGKAV